MKTSQKRPAALVGLSLVLASLTLTAGTAGEASGRLSPAIPAAATTFTVNSTGDAPDQLPGDGLCATGVLVGLPPVVECTLRAAIQESNVVPGTDTIAFNIPGAGVRTIAPATALPTVSDPVVIDGYTQPGSSANTLADGDNAVLLVELTGAGLSGGPASAFGLRIDAGGSTVRGLVVNRFASGIHLTTNGGNFIEGNFIGTDAAGASPAANSDGVRMTFSSSNNTVGGLTPAARNLISGNGFSAVFIEGSSTGNTVQGNFIGTDRGGTAKLSNNHGVFVATANNTVGGTSPAARNVISGNGQAGVFINAGSFPSSNRVQGNYIGTDVTGKSAVGNFFGVWINNGSGNSVGGTTPAAGNVISGNADSGVLITTSDNNVVSSNFIGTEAGGARPLGNGGHGVEIGPFSKNNRVHPQGTDAAGNTIAFNAGSGVALLGPADSGNDVILNSIFSNGGLGIDDGADGVTPNTVPPVSDPFLRPQNFPVITSVATSAAVTNVQGTLSSLPNTRYTLAFYASLACDPSGHGEGAREMGLRSVQTDASGNASFSFNFAPPLPAGHVVTATARGPSLNVSEFSPCGVAAGGAAGSVEFSAAAYSVIEDIGSFAVTLVRTGGGAGPLSVNFEMSGGTATPGADYADASGTITFADGEVTKTVNIPVVNDGVTEPDETVNLILFNPTTPDAAGARSRAVLNIIDASKQPAVSIGDATVNETLSGTREAVFFVSLSAATGRTVSVNFQTADGSAAAGQDYQPASGTLTFAPGQTLKIVTVVVNGDTLAEPTEETFFVDLSNPVNATVADGRGQGTIINNNTPVFQFAGAALSANEGDHVVTVTVIRLGAVGGSLSIDYATADGTASERSDYTTALGMLRFAPGELTKSFTVLLTDDGFQEPDETLNLTLSNPTGGAVLAGNSSAVLTISDNDPAPSAVNPIDTPNLFVRQHYHDFLNRVPDASGLAFWTGQLTGCGSDAACTDFRRVSVSQAFFLSTEFQRTGYQVIRVYKASFTDGPARPRGLPRLREFLRDTQELQRGVVVGQGDWEQRLQQNTLDYARRWVESAEFVAQFPASLTAEQYVDKLFQNSEVAPTAGERAAALAAYGAGGTEGRAQALLSVTGSGSVYNRQYNAAAVLMQYFGYLRRNPYDPPELNLDFGGYDFWLTKLNGHSLPGEDVRNEETARARLLRAEMVRSFIVSGEYRSRFGTP